jgi:hypothetical protein
MNAGIAAAALMIVPVPELSHLTGRYNSEGTGRTRPTEKSIKSSGVPLAVRVHNMVVETEILLSD